MRHFPIFLDTRGQKIVVSGAQACAVAKLRLLLKTEAEISVFGLEPDAVVLQWASEGRLHLTEALVSAEDLLGATLFYAANDEAELDLAVARIARAAGVKTLVVDNLEASDFITPAIVDRDPVTVAIGTEGAAPVLARKIKADLEERLPSGLGPLVQLGRAFRPEADRLPTGRPRRDFWSTFYFDRGPKALLQGEAAVNRTLRTLFYDVADAAKRPGHVHFVGAGPGDPELLTLKARTLLHEADVVIHDRLVSDAVLELCRREADRIEVGKTGFRPSWAQEDINALLVEHGADAQVVRLKSGDGAIFGRLDEETQALQRAGIAYSVVPGITAAAAAAAELKVSLTRRGRNSGLRIITGHEAKGFADQDWRALAQPGAVAAIYMGKRAAQFMQGRLLMHGASPDTPVTIVEHASRPNQTVVASSLLRMPEDLDGIEGPAVLMFGLAPDAVARQDRLAEAL